MIGRPFRSRKTSALQSPCPLRKRNLADLKWFEVFKDDKLRDLSRTALERNYDLRTAVANVEAARANLGRTRSNPYPNIEASSEIQFKTRPSSILQRFASRTRSPP